MQSTSSQSRESSPPSRPLARGQACMPCRWRKIRCDGVRPSCGQCTGSQETRECRYGDANTSHASNLQKTVTQLQARLRLLEQGESTTVQSTVLLHDPYSDNSPSYTTPPSQSRSASVDTNSDWPSPDICAILTDTFFQHVQCLPWFLHEGRHRQALTLPDNNPGRPIAALDAAVLLWGSILSSNTSPNFPAVHSETLLDYASSQVGLVNASGQQAIQIIQARLLLAIHFLDTCRVLEGRAHLAAATSLAFRLRLHKIRSSPSSSSLPNATFLDPMTIPLLPDPQDAVEEGERIRAFWTVFCFSRTHAVMFGQYSLVLDSESEERRIDTPWPLNMNLYDQDQMPQDLQSTGTLCRFFHGIRSGWPWENDMLSYLSKASALFERTARFDAVQQRDPTATDPTTSLTEFASLDQRTDELEAQLAPLTAGPAQGLHLAQSLVLTGRIQLHSSFAEQSPISRAKCLGAARAIWNVSVATRVETFVFLDPVIGWIWAAACRVLMSEVALLRAQPARSALPGTTTEAELVQTLDGILALMSALVTASSSMNFHLSRVEQERVVLC
ncbi:hypothetical protein PENSPDRAFT_752208 [Peniophora sp. CONT]|nr:hypothetical protein PENSPDRAFT_752208 [Peniophora sp. CONT]